jgi:hypothetical protein
MRNAIYAIDHQFDRMSNMNGEQLIGHQGIGLHCIVAC